METKNTKVTLALGETVRTPRGLILVVNTFNIQSLQRLADMNWPDYPRPTRKAVGPKRAVTSGR